MEGGKSDELDNSGPRELDSEEYMILENAASYLDTADKIKDNTYGLPNEFQRKWFFEAIYSITIDWGYQLIEKHVPSLVLKTKLRDFIAEEIKDKIFVEKINAVD